MNWRPHFLMTLLIALSWFSLSSQVIRLQNPSFEGEPRDATIPRAWHICKEGSTPDILPGFWGVYLEADEGNTFVGLITRDNGTWENIGQRLPTILQKNRCYTISMSLARSQTYAGYHSPIRLRIWGGGEKCEKEQLLSESEVIDQTEWKRFHFKFKIEQDIRYIILEAYDHKGEQTRGNLLIDNISAISLCSGA